MPEPLEGPALELATTALCVVAGASLHALERALSALGEVRLMAAAEAGGRDGKTARRLLDDADKLRARLFVGQVLSLALAAGLAVHLSSGAALPIGAPAVATLAACATGLIYGIVAAGLGVAAAARAPRVGLPMARWLRPLELLSAPFAVPTQAIVALHDRLLAPPPAAPSGDHAVREVEHMIEQGEESGTITEEFAELLLSVLDFKDTLAREVMVPRTQVKALAIDATIDQAIEMIEAHGHSRYPVYRERLDHIEGVLYAKDLFRILSEAGTSRKESLATIIRRPAFFVAETQKIGHLLREMQSRRSHLAVLVDEFGGTSGVVTLEDIVEEIVGEIQDEHDAEERPIQEVSSGHWWVDAAVSVHDLSRALDVDLETEEGHFDSIGGMIVEMAGGVPDPGGQVTFRGFEFIVREADERHVTRVEVRAQPDLDDPEHAAAE